MFWADSYTQHKYIYTINITYTTHTPQNLGSFVEEKYMATRCKKCGVPLSEDARFCRNCGTPVMLPGSAGTGKAYQRPEPRQYSQPQQTPQPAQQQYSQSQPAQQAASDPVYADGNYPGLGAYLKSYIRKIGDVLKNPKQLLPTIVLGAIWMALSVAGSFFRTLPLPLSVLSFLTYAQGGMYGGLLAAAGGIPGKVVVAAFLNAMIMPLFKGGKPFEGVAGGIGGVFRGAAVQGINEISPLTFGVGAALVLYGFMNSRQNLQEAMVGIVAVIMLLKNIGSKGGFMTGLIFSAASTFSGGRTPSRITVDRVLSGLTIGFTLAVALSALSFRPCVWAGLVFLAISIVFRFLGKGKRQAVAAGRA